MKKKICLSSILLCLIFILTACSFGNYSKEQTIKLIEKSANCSNYSMDILSNNQNLTIYYKDKIYKILSSEENDSTYTLYEDYNNDEIIISDETYAIVGKLSEYENDSNSEYLESISKTALDNFKSENYNYTFIEKTKYNDENCILVSLKYKENVTTDLGLPFEIKYTINVKNGFIVKIEEYNTSGKLINSSENKITLNKTTDEDVQRPDLTNLEVYNI